MTYRDPAQEFDPKHRIIGAVVIVALAVVLIPIILGKRESLPTQDVAAPTAAPSDSSARENKVAVMPVPPPNAATEPTRPKAAEPTEAKKRASVSPPARVEAPAKTETVAAKSATPPKAAAETKAAGGGWVVQVGTFSNTANATRMEQKLRAEGQPLLVENIHIDGGKAVRLRVGPFHDRAAAVKAQERIRKEAGVQGVVLSYP